MNGKQLKKKLLDGGIVYGTMLSASRSLRWTTPINDFGLDFVIIDSEHAPRGRTEIADLLTALSSTKLVTIVRLPYPDSHLAAMELDAGAEGILAPYCETVQEAKDVVESVKPLREGARFVLYNSDARTLHKGFSREFDAIKAVGEEIGGGSCKPVGESQEVI